MKIHILEGDVHRLDVRTRLPFKYGIATMTSTPHVFVRLRLNVDGQPATGTAADHLPPKWFTKDPNKSIADEINDMLRVIDNALRVAAGIVAENPFDAWRQLWQAQHAWGRNETLPSLLAHFGTSLVERAMIEAVCRSANEPFAKLLWHNRFGIRLEDIHPVLSGGPGEYLPQRPLGRIIVRQTVGLADPLTDADIAPGERLDDGLPQSVTACIQAYGLRHIKIKLSGQLDGDRERLSRLAAVMSQHAPPDFAFSVDGNEQFHTVAEFRRFWHELQQTAELRSFFAHLLFVEQPLHRDVALNRAMGNMTDWLDRPAMIIDESDSDLTSLPRALELGYAGTSHKNCKGVFKSVANACLLVHRQRQRQPVIMSGEDLANIGPVALLQDLAVCAALGIGSVERNGHHYFAGLSMFPRQVQRQILEAHGDLYHASPHGWPTLTIKDGALATQSVIAAPFGVGPVLDVDAFSAGGLA
jgi:hypothetical protein